MRSVLFTCFFFLRKKHFVRVNEAFVRAKTTRKPFLTPTIDSAFLLGAKRSIDGR